MRLPARACLLLGKGGVVVIIAGVLLGIVLWSTSATARQVFRWIDSRGVIHYSHSPPPAGITYQVRRMPTPRPKRLAAESVEKERVEGEAYVELTNSSTEEVRRDTRVFKGEVKNTGEAAANNVFVSLTVADAQKGTECLSAELEVSPSSLAPGGSGTFESEFQHPCFSGNASVRLEPVWK